MPGAKKEPVLVEGKFLLRKYPGKGGWTYVTIPPLPVKKINAFGFLRVKGSVDAVELDGAGIWKTKTGDFFMPVNAALRKKLGKQDGDTVQIVLKQADENLQLPGEIHLCLADEPGALDKFKALPTAQQDKYIRWIAAAKKESLKVERIAEMMKELAGRRKGEVGSKI